MLIMHICANYAFIMRILLNDYAERTVASTGWAMTGATQLVHPFVGFWNDDTFKEFRANMS